MASEELTDDRIVGIIQELLTGSRVEDIALRTRPLIVKFTYPTSTERQYIDYFYERRLHKAVSDGFMLEKDLPEGLDKEVFSSEDQEELVTVEFKITALKKLLSKRIKGSKPYIKDSEILQKYENRRTILLSKKGLTSKFSAEYKAKEEKYFELLTLCTKEFKTEKKIWNSYEEALDNVEYSEAYSLLNNFLDFYWGYDAKILRRIARSNMWRAYYLSSKNTGQELMSVPLKDAHLGFLELMSWTMFYQSIYEMLPSERPSEEIIKDDEKLDKFMLDFDVKRKKEAEMSKKKRASKEDKFNASTKDQTIVTAGSKDYVKLHKEGEYSDPKIITSRTSSEDSRTYSEVKEFKDKKREQRAKRRQRLGKVGR